VQQQVVEEVKVEVEAKEVVYEVEEVKGDDTNAA
jgi:hypothetical protein